MELTSELIVSDSVVGLTPDFQLGARNRRGSKSISGTEGRRRSARPGSVPSFSIHTFPSGPVS